MKHAIFFAALAIASTAVAQQQIHVVGGDTPYMFKADKVKNISYKGNATDGYTHMVVTDKNDAVTEVAITDEVQLAILYEGVADPTIVPVEASSDEFKLLTARQWSFAGASGAGEGYTYPVDWLGECVNDDKISFTADGKVIYDLGANNEVYCEFNPSPKTFTATGDEAFVLGRKDGVLFMQFVEGAFPVYRANIKGKGPVYSMSEPYEVVKLTDTALELKADVPGGEWVVIKFEREPEVVLTPEEMLCAHSWKMVFAGPSITENWGAAGSDDEVMTFKANGSMAIVGDGKAESCNDGQFDYTDYTDMTWKYVENEGKRYIEFGNNGFPCAVASIGNLGKTWEIVELKSDAFTIKIVETGLDWLADYYLKFEVAE